MKKLFLILSTKQDILPELLANKYMLTRCQSVISNIGNNQTTMKQTKSDITNLKLDAQLLLDLNPEYPNILNGIIFVTNNIEIVLDDYSTRTQQTEAVQNAAVGLRKTVDYYLQVKKEWNSM